MRGKEVKGQREIGTMRKIRHLASSVHPGPPRASVCREDTVQRQWYPAISKCRELSTLQTFRLAQKWTNVRFDDHGLSQQTLKLQGQPEPCSFQDDLCVSINRRQNPNCLQKYLMFLIKESFKVSRGISQSERDLNTSALR